MTTSKVASYMRWRHENTMVAGASHACHCHSQCRLIEHSPNHRMQIARTHFSRKLPATVERYHICSRIGSTKPRKNNHKRIERRT